MNISTLIKDTKKINSILHELNDGSVICSQECKIYVPTRYKERNLAYVGVDTYILGIYAIVVENKYYSVSLVNAMINIDPTTVNKIIIEEEEYFEFVFSKGSKVIKSLDLVKTNTIVYYIFDEFFAKGYIPWYVKYEELGKVFDTALYHAGANVGSYSEVIQLITSLVARDSKDKSKYYRNVITNHNDLINNPPVFVPLKSIEYSATNTVSKLAGSYMSKGIISSLNTPTKRVERIEKILTA